VTATQATYPAHDSRPLELTGHVFGRATIIILLGLLTVAAWFRQTAVVTLIGLTLATVGFSRLWSTLALRRVRCDRVLSTRGLFVGEQLTLTVRLSNQKPLPLPWVDVSQLLPPRLASALPDAESRDATLVRTASMPWYSRVTWREQVCAGHRGWYVLPPVKVVSGDILGLYPRAMEQSGFDHVAVYPRIYPVRRLSIRRTDASGDLLGRVSLQEDPTRMRGIRDYQPQDGMRRVHWKATARHRQLMVKLYEPSAVSRLVLVLVADSFDPIGDDTPFELAASAVASVAHYCAGHQMQFGLLSNAKLGDGSGHAGLPPGGGDPQFIALLEILARATAGTALPFDVMARELHSLAASGVGLVVAAGRLQPQHVDTFTVLARSRCPMLVLEMTPESSSRRFAFGHKRVTGPGDLLDLGGDGQ